MENRLRRYDINRARTRHGYKYTKYNICLGIMIRCNKQHLSKILGSVHEKVKQH